MPEENYYEKEYRELEKKYRKLQEKYFKVKIERNQFYLIIGNFVPFILVGGLAFMHARYHSELGLDGRIGLYGLTFAVLVSALGINRWANKKTEED